ncbi:hypothetical protein AB595_16115 [Massilia sp. WF1]|uniref:hypothetical protein n=2 Tax=unclassified Massilia TaxID=2609279 RepID=UPI00064A2E52|nr:hypothetical protein [Massilia sp. WF1]ALK97868.1 hypothetical protein AM586_18325 [Massilia sp. WG5]KLU35787.1 hypothetical protein AB595_16115 [Massilia sp. WF1]
MKASIFLMHATTVALLLAAAACTRHGDQAMRETKFPGMVTAGGGTSGQVMARNDKRKTDATYAGGTPGIAGGAGGNTAGAGTGGSVTETGQGPSKGVSTPAKGSAQMGATDKPSGDSGTNPVKPDAAPAPQPAAAHRDPGANSAAPGR